MTTDGMVRVPGGTVALRDDRVGRRWEVEVAPFLLARFPVTRAEHRDVTGTAAGAGDDRAPVTEVSWLDAIRHSDARSRREGLRPCYEQAGGEVVWDRDADGYRLPTEAEWLHACRAGGTAPRYGDLDAIAWYGRDDGPQPVGGKAPNAWGLHDLLGNVWEWCWDLYDAEVYGEYRVFRGGGWADPPRGVLATNRRRSHPTFRVDDLGFRVARSLP